MDEWKCWDLITLDILYAYCRGPEPTLEARRLNAYSRRRKLPILNLFLSPSTCLRLLLVLILLICLFVEMEAVRLRVQVRVTAARKKEEGKAKEKEGVSSSAPKAVSKGVTKRKGDGKDDRPSKKAFVTLGEKLPKKSSPPKPKHGASKRLITTSGPVAQDPDRRFFTHKDYALEMVGSIIRDKDVDRCAEQGMEELGVSGLFDLARICFFLCSFIHSLCLIADGYPVLQALVPMKALQDRGVAKEGVITYLHKCIKNLTDGQEQYKSARRTLNQEVKELKEKLEEEGRQKKKEQEAKEMVEKQLAALLGQVEMAKADTVKKFRAS